MKYITVKTAYLLDRSVDIGHEVMITSRIVDLDAVERAEMATVAVDKHLRSTLNSNILVCAPLEQRGVDLTGTIRYDEDRYDDN